MMEKPLTSLLHQNTRKMEGDTWKKLVEQWKEAGGCVCLLAVCGGGGVRRHALRQNSGHS